VRAPRRCVEALVLAGVVASGGCKDGESAPAATPAMPDAPAGPILPTFAAAGASAVSTCEVAAPAGPCTASADGGAPGALYVVFYPTDLATAGARHPILTWGNGTDAVPAQYTVLLTHLASWGFVVIASTSTQTGTGRELVAGVDYLARANADAASPFHGRLDVGHVGAMGHSQGADGAALALLRTQAPGSAHPPIATLVPIELPAQKWTCFASTDPSCLPAESFDAKSLVRGSVFYVGSSKDTVAPPTQDAGIAGEQSMQAYYDATPASTPRAKGTLLGADHNDIQDHCAASCGGLGPQPYLGPITAWLMYQLRGDARARAVFVGSAPEFDRDPAWEYQEQARLP
jgi:hypothetical protein